jgi:hypothetical protein
LRAYGEKTLKRLRKNRFRFEGEIVMKWLNSRRFAICLACLGIITYQAVSGRCGDTRIAESLIPVLVAFMGATTIEKASQEFSKFRRNKKEEDDD